MDGNQETVHSTDEPSPTEGMEVHSQHCGKARTNDCRELPNHCFSHAICMGFTYQVNQIEKLFEYVGKLDNKHRKNNVIIKNLKEIILKIIWWKSFFSGLMESDAIQETCGTNTVRLNTRKLRNISQIP